MNVLEMHIEIDQALQEVNSNATTIIKPHEKDLALIAAEDSFIKSRLRPRKNGLEGFEVDQVYADDIQTLYTHKKVKCFYDEDLERPYSILPYDYKFLIKDTSHVLTDKNSKFVSGVSTNTKNINVLKFETSAEETEPYTALKITVNNVVQFDITDFISVPLGYKEDKFILVNLIMKTLNKNYEVYWETYDGDYYPDSFIFVSDTSITTTILVDSVLKAGTISTKNYKVYTASEKDFIKNNRTYKSNNVDEIIYNNYFYKTCPTSPVSVLANNKLSIFVDNRFIVNFLTVYYVRKQRRISLMLNQSSELPESTHLQICALAVEKLKKNLNSRNLEQTTQHNVIRVD